MLIAQQTEYLVQVTVIEGRHLTAKGDDGLANPFCKIRIGKSNIQSSEVVYESLTPVWNQSFTFPNLMLSEQEFQTGNSLIGCYSVGLSTLYKNANHEYYNVWLTLSNPEYPEESQGYLLIDCFIVRAGDRPPVRSINDAFNQDVGEEDEDLNLDNMKFDELKAYQEKQQGIIILGKPTVARKAFQLSCYIIKCENLSSFEGLLGKVKPSAFISVRTAGLVQTTKTIGSNSSPNFNQKILFPTYLPFLNDKIIMRIWHGVPGASDEFIGNIPEFSTPNDVFNISKLLSMGGRMAAIWVNIYCIPPWERNKGIFSTKKKHPSMGTYFMGRILVSFTLLPNPTPFFGVLPCNTMGDPASQAYRLFADVYKIKYLKYHDIVVWCDVSIGGYVTANKKKKPKKDNSVEWTCTDEKNEISLVQIMQHFPCEYSQIPDIFISLYTGSGLNDSQRIGFIRLKADEVLKYEPTPRWLHFNPIDLNNDSPGSILINIVFCVESNNVKRVLKEKGLDKKFKLHCHIIQGFDLDPTNKDKANTEYSIEVIMDSNSAKTQVQVNKQTILIPPKNNKGDFPFYNCKKEIAADLDMKLDFAPDVVVNLKNDRNEIIGVFTVPIRTIKKKNDNDYPHYFNFIKNNEINGRLLAMFYIAPDSKAKNDLVIFPLYKRLEIKKKANVKIYIHGLRDIDFKTIYDNCKFELRILENVTNISQIKVAEIPHLEKLNEKENLNFLNICKVFEFNTTIYGNPDVILSQDNPDEEEANLSIFPMVEIKLIQSGIFSSTERFLIMNLSEFYRDFSERTKLKYRRILNDFLYARTIDQEQKLINIKSASSKNNKDDEAPVNDDEEMNEEEIILFGPKPTGGKGNQKNPADAAPKIVAKPITQKVINDFITKYEKFDKHKFLDIKDESLLCLNADKEKERAANKKIRDEKKKELDELRKKENLSPTEVEQLINLQTEIRELRKPLMSEGLFYGFEDISDDYDYGTDVYKDDIYEFHPNFSIFYIEKQMLYIPTGLFEDKCRDIGGYMKLGKEGITKLKFNIKVSILDDNAPEEPELPTADLKKEKIQKEIDNLQFYENDKELDEFLKKELEEIDIFDSLYAEKINCVYFNKETKKKTPKDKIIIPLNNLRVRIYIYRCLNLTAQENSSGSIENAAGYTAFCKANSYIEIKLGDNENSGDDKSTKYINDSHSFVPSTLNPSFFKFYELEADFPQDWKLEINIKSKGTTTDSLIGSTMIDVENRYLGDVRCRDVLKCKSLEERYSSWFNPDLDDDKKKELNRRISAIQVRLKEIEKQKIPVEFRPLFKPGTQTAQGVVEMFVEVLPMKIAKMTKPLKIEPPPVQEFELRLVIWETRNVFHERKKTLSLYIKVVYDPEGWLKTDCHLGCDTGRGVYNWRMKFPIKIPCTFPRLSFKVFDFNTVGSDEALSECYISLKRVFKKLMREGELILDKKWIPLSKGNDSGDTKGEILISVYLIPQDMANNDPVGESQDEPNKNPKLEKPKEGRGMLDFLKGSFLDLSGWSFNFDLFGTFRLIVMLVSFLLVFVVLFISPGLLTK